MNGVDTGSVSSCLIVESEPAHTVPAVPLDIFELELTLSLFEESKVLHQIISFWQPSELRSRSLGVDRQALFTVFLIIFVWGLTLVFIIVFLLVYQILVVNGRVRHITVPAVVKMFAFFSRLALFE